LGRSLYWVGVQVEILALARRTDFSEGISLAIAVTVAALVTGLMLAWISVMDLPASFLDRFGHANNAIAKNIFYQTMASR
jgi:hypothetical protein